MKENKGLTDKQLVEKYEAGAINLGETIKKLSNGKPKVIKPLPKIKGS